MTKETIVPARGMITTEYLMKAKDQLHYASKWCQIGSGHNFDRSMLEAVQNIISHLENELNWRK